MWCTATIVAARRDTCWDTPTVNPLSMRDCEPRLRIRCPLRQEFVALRRSIQRAMSLSSNLT